MRRQVLWGSQNTTELLLFRAQRRFRTGPLRRKAVGQRAISRREISTDRAPGNPDLGGGVSIVAGIDSG